MQNSKEFMKKHAILPKISFKESPEHTVELVKDKLSQLPDQNTGQMKDVVEYLVKENGEPKTFSTSSPKLVSELSEYNPGDVVTIKMIKVKGGDGFKSSYTVFGESKSVGSSTTPSTTEEPPEEEPIEISDDVIDDIPF